MSKKTYGPLFYFSRGVVRLFIPTYEVASLPELNEPVVYVSHHQNMIGPVSVLAWLKRPVRTWVFSAFTDQEETYDHYVNYTFTERFGWPKTLAKLVVWPISHFIAKLMASGNAIPVYRKSKKIMRTMKMSVEALQEGEDILIFPDVDYSDDSAEVGEIYEGFLFLEKYYYRKTKKHLAFVPLFSDKANKEIRSGNIIRFTGDKRFVEERTEIAEELHQELNRLANESSENNDSITPSV